MRATKKKQQKKHRWKNVFLSPEINLFFFGMFFYLPKLTGFFSEIGKNTMRARQKKTTFQMSIYAKSTCVHALIAMGIFHYMCG